MTNTLNRSNWLANRRDATSSALDRCFAEGLTGHTVTARDGKRIKLVDGSWVTEFVSCSYLGLESHPDLSGAVVEATRAFGVHLSSSRNRMRPRYLPELEELLGQIYPGAAACVFTSTSNVHLGVLPLLASGSLPSYPMTGEPLFLLDRTAHASMQVLRGIFEQFGSVRRVAAQDLEAVRAELARATGQGRVPILLVDGVGSMSGLVPVAELAALLAAAGGYLYVDDAHGISLEGERGAGYAFTALGNRLPANVIMAGSLSKGFGGSGGFLLAEDTEDIIVVRRLANPLVFGHSVMVPMMAANVAAAQLHVRGALREPQRRLWANTEQVDRLTDGKLVNAGLRSPSRGATFDTEEAGLRTARLLRERGIVMLPAFYPTVERGRSLLRFAISALHSSTDIALLAQTLEEVGGYHPGGRGEAHD